MPKRRLSEISDSINISDATLLEILKGKGGYSPIIAASSPSLTGKGGGIKKKQVEVIVSGKRETLTQYEYDEKSRDHRAALASRMRYHKDELLANRDTAKLTKFVIKDSKGRTLRVDPRYDTRDFVLYSLRAGAGEKKNPYRFTNKRISYADPNELIDSASSMFERGRSDIAGILKQIAPSLGEAVYAPKGGVAFMKQVENATRINAAAVKKAVEQLREYARKNKLYTKEKLIDHLKKRRMTPPRPSLVTRASDIPSLDLPPAAQSSPSVLTSARSLIDTRQPASSDAEGGASDRASLSLLNSLSKKQPTLSTG